MPGFSGHGSIARSLHRLGRPRTLIRVMPARQIHRGKAQGAFRDRGSVRISRTGRRLIRPTLGR
jgi:hypothetical protein